MAFIVKSYHLISLARQVMALLELFMEDVFIRAIANQDHSEEHYSNLYSKSKVDIRNVSNVIYGIVAQSV